MGDIVAGIVCTTKFCKSADKAFKSYIDYIDRDNATKKDNLDKFNLFNDYLDYVGDTKKLGYSQRINLSLTMKRRKS